jgi:nicotinamide-nucleotide amidase
MIRERLPNYQQQTIRRIQTFGIGESTLQQLFNETLSAWPDTIELGFRAGFPLLEVKLSTLLAATDPTLDYWQGKLEALLAEELVGYGSITLQQRLVQLLNEQGKTLTTAESCTGGLIASMITEVAGASHCFHAGIVSYSNAVKASVLNVNQDTLDTYGAVSKEVVIEMLSGALKLSAADYGIAVSGIAGPDGGSDDKPVGTVWIAWGSQEQIHTQEMLITGSRKWFQKMVAACSLDLIRRELLGLRGEPRYFSRY